jgi:hypothetical protein
MRRRHREQQSTDGLGLSRALAPQYTSGKARSLAGRIAGKRWWGDQISVAD